MKKLFLSFVMMLMAVGGAWAEDVTLQDANGTKYVNMPVTGTNTLTLTDTSVKFFKVYDDGGAEEQYSNYCDGYLVLTAPAGYRLQVSGNIMTESGSYDVLTIYDGATTEAEVLLDQKASSPNNGDVTDIGVISSSGQSVMLYFKSDHSSVYDGLDLDVTLFKTDDVHSITINSVEGGVLHSDKATAKYGETVTLTWTHETGYVLEGLTVTDAYGRPVSITGGSWYNAATHFDMPVSNVTITPKFVKATTSVDGLFVNIPQEGTRTCDIATGVQSFKVYDNGGMENDYSNYCAGYLIVTAPAGYRLQLTGTVTTETCDYLTVYDGTTTEEVLLDQKSSPSNNETTDIGIITSTGESMMIYFYADHSNTYSGLDLEVTLFNPNEAYPINITSATGGVLSSDKATAKFNDTVTLTETHENGYVLESVTVTDINNRIVKVTGSTWHNVVGSFTMPASAATVTPTFIQATTIADGLFINMPTTGTFTTNISTGVKSFKVYDDGGAEGEYSDSNDGYLVLTVPVGYRLQVTGTVNAEPGCDYLTIYDGTDNEAAVLLDKKSSTDRHNPVDIGVITSSSHHLTLYFYTDGSQTDPGLDLNVYVFNPDEAHAVTVQTATGGVMQSDKASAKFGETINLSETHQRGNILLNTVVSDVNGTPVVVNGGTWYNVPASFDMPIAEAIVTPTFTTASTAEDGLFINMPKEGILTTDICNGVKSFKVYDDGGAEGNYSDYCDGTLVLTAPVGYMLRLMGTISAEGAGYDFLTVYDGTEIDETKILLDKKSSTSAYVAEEIGEAVSTARSLMLYFKSDHSNSSAGLDLTVTLIPITYTLSFNNGKEGATGTMEITGSMESMMLTYDDPKALTANGFSRTGYDFAGWAKAVNDTVFFADKAVVENLASVQGAEVTLYAKWKPIVYTITYDLASGKLEEGVENPATYTIETPDFTLVNPTRKGYTFLGWESTGWDASEGSVVETVTVTTGHHANLSFTAKWEANTYKVIFEANNGEGEMAAQDFTYDEAQALTANAFTRKGYTFEGWNTKADGSGKAYADKEEVKNLTAKRDGKVKLYAQWKAIVYTISYDLAGGAVATENPVEYTIESDDITLVNPTREGNLFAGWTGTDLEGAVATVTIAKGSIGNREYTATWRIVGDVNNDGIIDVADIIATLSLISNNAYDKAADMDGDNDVDLTDVQAIMSCIAEMDATE